MPQSEGFLMELDKDKPMIQVRKPTNRLWLGRIPSMTPSDPCPYIISSPLIEAKYDEISFLYDNVILCGKVEIIWVNLI